MMRSIVRGISVVATGMALAMVISMSAAWAQVPQKINYQARLTDAATGEAVQNGSYDMSFALYDAATNGNLVWGPELWNSGTTKVAVADGVFSVLLGTHEPLDGTSFDKGYWLERKVYNDTTLSWETFAPRQEMASVGYALMAAKVETGATGNFSDLYTTGNLGVGTTTPGYTLDVAGDVNFTGMLYQNGSPVSGDGYSLDAADGSPVDALYVDNSGNVGIGTTAPGAPLDVDVDQSRSLLTGTSKGIVHFVGGRDYTASDVSAITLGSASSFPNLPGAIIGTQVTNEGSKLFFGTSDSFQNGVTNTAMLIDKSGYVGIGTTEPGSTLDVAGTAQLRGTTGGIGLYVNPSGFVGIGTSGPLYKLDILTASSDDGLRISTAGTNRPSVHIKDTTNSRHFVFRLAGGSSELAQLGGGPSGTSLSAVQIGTDITSGTISNPYLSLTASDIEIMNGNVGIGTASPGSKLDVVGNVEADGFTINGVPVATSTDTYWSAGTGAIYYNSGNVGIGTTSPGARLEVAVPWANKSKIRMSTSKDSTAGVTPMGEIEVGWAGSDWGDGYLGINAPAALPFENDPERALTIRATGNVGIGTTSPGTKLDVNGTVNATAFVGDGSGLTNVGGSGDDHSLNGDGGSPVDALYVNSSGNVGIGTTGPTTKLEIAETTHGANVELRFYAENNAGTARTGLIGIDPDAEHLGIGGSGASSPAIAIQNVDGNVGIGTTSPGSKLSVVGLPTSSAGLSSGDIWRDGDTLKIVP